MSGKRSIDCVRENEDAPAVHELQRGRLTQRRARRRAHEAPGVPPEAGWRGAPSVRPGGGVEEAQGPEQEAARA